MTGREYYQKLAAAATDGTFPSGDYSQCYYRRGRQRCAVGIIIPDEMYDPKFEGRRASQLPIDLPSLIEERPAREFFGSIQLAHDCRAFKWDPEGFLNDVRCIFQTYGVPY